MKGLNCSQFVTFTAGTISSPRYNAPVMDFTARTSSVSPSSYAHHMLSMWAFSTTRRSVQPLTRSRVHALRWQQLSHSLFPLLTQWLDIKPEIKHFCLALHILPLPELEFLQELASLMWRLILDYFLFLNFLSILTLTSWTCLVHHVELSKKILGNAFSS